MGFEVIGGLDGKFFEVPVSCFEDGMGGIIYTVSPEINVKEYESILITAKLRELEDLTRLIFLGRAVFNAGFECKISLYAPFIPGWFYSGGMDISPRIYCEIINSFGFDQVNVVNCPPIVEAMLDNVHIFSAKTIARAMFNQHGIVEYEGIIPCRSIDLKAAKEFSEVLGIPVSNGSVKGDYLVVSGVCQSGAWELEATERIKRGYLLDLCVIHGFFFEGLNRLSEHYGEIFSTDTVCELEDGNLKLIKLI